MQSARHEGSRDRLRESDSVEFEGEIMKTIIYAVRISKVSQFTEDGGLLEFADAESREVATTWLEKHQPSAGQYYVKYSDGFTGVVASLC